MFLQNLRLTIIKGLIDLNERIFFNRKILAFYKTDNLQTIIDIGSNRGQSIDLFLKINSQCNIYAFEPNSTLFEYLNKKYSKVKNVKIFNFGISDCESTKIFYENVLDYTSSFETINVSSNYLAKKSRILNVNKNSTVSNSYLVQTIKLSDFIITNIEKNTTIDLIKIDTEGHEYYCLLGLFSKEIPNKIKYIQLEHQNSDLYENKVGFNTINDFMEKNNFKLIRKIKHGFGNFDELIYSSNANEK